jgi:hypothetical protein
MVIFFLIKNKVDSIVGFTANYFKLYYCIYILSDPG